MCTTNFVFYESIILTCMFVYFKNKALFFFKVSALYRLKYGFSHIHYHSLSLWTNLSNNNQCSHPSFHFGLANLSYGLSCKENHFEPDIFGETCHLRLKINISAVAQISRSFLLFIVVFTNMIF